MASPEPDTAAASLEKRLWSAADQFRANSGLKAQEYSGPLLGLIFLRFAEVRFSAHRSELEKASTSARRGSRVDEPAAYHAEGILYLAPAARFNFSGTLLKELLKKVSEIPATVDFDAFGRIYEYFLATSLDYDPTQSESIRFFQTVQNKMHWVITSQTVAEIIHTCADSTQPNMGLTNWRGAEVRKDDVSIAKNYLNEPELGALNNLFEQYLVFAEGQAKRRVPMHMKDWITKLYGFMTVNDRDILTHAGKYRTRWPRNLLTLSTTSSIGSAY